MSALSNTVGGVVKNSCPFKSLPEKLLVVPKRKEGFKFKMLAMRSSVSVFSP